MQGASCCSRESPRTPRSPLFLAEHRFTHLSNSRYCRFSPFTDWETKKHRLLTHYKNNPNTRRSCKDTANWGKALPCRIGAQRRVRKQNGPHEFIPRN